jgi:hypothetical protein
MQAGNPAWDDFNKRRNAAIRNQGFTTKESAKAPVDTTAPGGMQRVPLSQDATNAYLQSIGVTPGGGGSTPQYVSAPQYAPQMVYAAQQPVYAPLTQPPAQEVDLRHPRSLLRSAALPGAGARRKFPPVAVRKGTQKVFTGGCEERCLEGFEVLKRILTCVHPSHEL